MITEICEAIHKTLPRPGLRVIPVEYNRALLAAVAFVECVTKRGPVYACEWEQTMSNGHTMFRFKVQACNDLINFLLEKLFEQHALFSLTSITQSLHRGAIESTCLFHFSDYIGLQLNTGISFADDCTDHDDYKSKLSEPLGHLIVELMNAHSIMDKVHPDTIRWFADRLPENEVRGPHILALQNFLYRRS